MNAHWYRITTLVN